MRISRIYTPQALAEQQILRLEEKASHYLSKVLRLKIGAQLILFNGLGGQYHASISGIEKKIVSVTIGEQDPVERESPLQIHLGIAISKGDRIDWVIQKATELGVSELTPLTSQRTEVKLSAERLAKKIQHWQQIAISACEQCGRNRIPHVNNLQPLSDWQQGVNAELKWVLHPKDDDDSPPADNSEVSEAALLIGPEGGFSEEEIILAKSSGFEAITLGPRILRTETAPLAAIAVLQQRWGDF